MQPLFKIEEPNVWNALLSSKMYAAWDSYPRIIISLGRLKGHTVMSEQSFIKQYYRFDIERARLAQNNRVGCASVASRQGLS